MVQCSWKKTWYVLLLTILIPITAMFWRIVFMQLIDLADVKKCPVCYGTSLCRELFNHSMKLDKEHLLRNIINMLNSKKVLFGTLNGDKVVIKNLASETDYENIRNIYMDTLTDSNVMSITASIDDFLRSPYCDKTIENIRLCPSTENLMDLLSPVIQNNKNDDMRSLYSHIWTSFRLNTEPLIQQVLHGWPVARYYGSCGRLVVSEYCGVSLTEYAVAADWKHRFSVAQQLLEAAVNFTLSHSHFAFYFTDISADNIAVSNDGIAKFVDLEHVIIVDKNPKDRPQFWDHMHQSENFGVEDAFAFSTNDICNHQISDHNVYSVCKASGPWPVAASHGVTCITSWLAYLSHTPMRSDELLDRKDNVFIRIVCMYSEDVALLVTEEILWKKSPLISGGLLHNPPLPFQQQLQYLLDLCVSPSDGLSRFHIASKLIALLA